jgi:Fibronectin type III-like domain/Glycosyl hydrolase family 3 N terminal domain
MTDESHARIAGRVLVLIAVILVSYLAATAQELPYRNPNLPVEQRIADLLSRMSLEEKVAQLDGAWENRQFFSDPNALFVDDKGAFVPERAAVLLKYGLGEMSRPSEKRGPRAMAEFTNTMQRWIRDNTRLGIPVLFHEERLYGHAALQGTSYPQAIALAFTWDPELVQRSTTLPLFSFGWGLSYSTVKCANVRATPESIGPEGHATVSVDVTSTGTVRGDEVVQLYIRDEVRSVTRPVKELRGLRRVTINPGETKAVEFTLGPNELSFLNRDMQRVVEPGVFQIIVSGNSADFLQTKLDVVAK